VSAHKMKNENADKKWRRVKYAKLALYRPGRRKKKTSHAKTTQHKLKIEHEKKDSEKKTRTQGGGTLMTRLAINSPDEKSEIFKEVGGIQSEGEEKGEESESRRVGMLGDGQLGLGCQRKKIPYRSSMGGRCVPMWCSREEGRGRGDHLIGWGGK